MRLHFCCVFFFTAVFLGVSVREGSPFLVIPFRLRPNPSPQPFLVSCVCARTRTVTILSFFLLLLPLLLLLLLLLLLFLLFVVVVVADSLRWDNAGKPGRNKIGGAGEARSDSRFALRLLLRLPRSPVSRTGRKNPAGALIITSVLVARVRLAYKKCTNLGGYIGIIDVLKFVSKVLIFTPRVVCHNRLANSQRGLQMLQLPATQLAKVSIDLKFVELKADVLEIFFDEIFFATLAGEDVRSELNGWT